MSYETLELTVEDAVATIRLNRPDAANSLNPLMGREFMEVCTACDDDSAIRVVILTGTGRMFSAGGDLGAVGSAGENARTVLKNMATSLHIGISRLARMDAPVIAAVNGMAAGAGFSMALAADLVVAAESAGFVMAYTNAGLVPDGSSTFFLPRRIGDRRARELMLTNRRLDAAEALEWGIVNQVVPDEDLMATTRVLARKLAAGPTLAYGAVKRLLNASFETALEAQMELEARAISEAVETEDGREGVSAFLAKRKPAFKGR